jgi:hypothetical protein
VTGDLNGANPKDAKSDASDAPSDLPVAEISPAGKDKGTPDDVQKPAARALRYPAIGKALGFLRQRLEWLSKHAAIWTALATIVYAGFASLQWYELRKTTELIRSSNQTNAINSLRAQRDVINQLALAERSAKATETAAKAAGSAAETAVAGLGETRKANRIAEAAIGVSAKQLERIDRPVITARIFADRPVEATSGGMQFSFGIVLMNEGRSPASNVKVMSAISYTGREEPRKELEATCSFVDKILKADNVGVAIQPSERHEEGFVEFLHAETIRAAHLVQIPGISGEFFAPVIVGCVAYQIPYSKELHHTRFAKSIYRKIHTSVLWAVYELGVSVPASDVIFSPHAYTKEEAD